MKDILPILAIPVLGLFGMFGIDASEQQAIALVTGIGMVVTTIYAIIQRNKK